MQIEIPELLLPMLEPRRYKSLEGGRGSGKSHTAARLLVALGTTRKLNVACCREIQKSIEGSVKKLLDNIIDEFELGTRGNGSGYYESQKTKIVSALGGEFTFHGLQGHRADDVKSLEDADIAWIEEAQRVSAHSWQVLTPTIRKENSFGPGNHSEIWATWNPDSEDDEVYQRTWKRPWLPLDQMLRLKINWRDNPWYGEVLEGERLTLKALNDDLYQHIWEGKLRTAAGLLFKRRWFDVNRYELGQHPEHLRKYLATDTASTEIDDPEVKAEPDWTELGVWGADQNLDLWALDWWSGQTDPEEWIQAIAMLIKRHSPERMFEEKGPIYRATKSAVDRRLKELGAFTVRTPLASINSKAERAMGAVARASALTIHIPNTPWGDRLVNQLCAFTGQEGKTDDMVDVLSILCRGLDSVGEAEVPQVKERRIITPYTEAGFLRNRAARDRDFDPEDYDR